MNLFNLNTEIVKEIVSALESIHFGSVEIVVQEGIVTQISTRSIKKTSITNKKSLNQRHREVSL